MLWAQCLRPNSTDRSILQAYYNIVASGLYRYLDIRVSALEFTIRDVRDWFYVFVSSSAVGVLAFLIMAVLICQYYATYYRWYLIVPNF